MNSRFPCRRRWASLLILFSLATGLRAVPVVSSISRELDEETVLTFAAADFTVSYFDPDSLPLATVRLLSLPENGTLKLAGIPIASAPVDIPIASITSLTFTPPVNHYDFASKSIQWNGSNGSSFAAEPADLYLKVDNVPDPVTITGQIPVATPEGSPFVLTPLELIVDDPDGVFPAGTDVIVLDGDNYSHQPDSSNVLVTPLPGFVGTLSVPVKMITSGRESNVFNLSLAVNPSEWRIQQGGRLIPEPGGGQRVTFTGRPGEIYAVQYSDGLLPSDWHPLGAHTTGANALLSIVDVPPPGTARRFYRMALPYRNDFSGGLGAATWRGVPDWVDIQGNGAIRLVNNARLFEMNAVVFDGIPATPDLGGFVARFNLALGPAGIESPGDGVSFAVGDLGTFEWGAPGPGPMPGSNLAVCFDVSPHGDPAHDTGIHVWVNGLHIAANPTNPFTQNLFVPVEISYLVGGGLTVKFNGATVFNNLAIPGFAFPLNGQFGIGGSSSTLRLRAFVDDVVISPR